MKRIFLLLILACLPFFCIFAQDIEDRIDIDTIEKEKTHPLIGVWQQCRVVQNPNDPSDQKIYRAPNFKFLNKDGSFSNMILSDKNQISNITVYGTYEINSDEQYTEIIEKSHTNPNDTNRKAKINYRLEKENTYLIISYFTLNSATGEPMQGREFWIRVEPGNPFKKEDSNNN